MVIVSLEYEAPGKKSASVNLTLKGGWVGIYRSDRSAARGDCISRLDDSITYSRSTVFRAILGLSGIFRKYYSSRSESSARF